MKKIKFIVLFSILCLLFVIPASFAIDNQTVVAADDAGEDNLAVNDYYFDVNIENDTGNGSQYNPYKEFTTDRIKDDSVIHLASGEYKLNSQVSKRNLTIVGGDCEKTIVDCKNYGFTVSSSLTLKNLTIYNSKSSLIKSTGLNNVTLINCIFINNHGQSGGVVNIENGVLNIENSLFEDNYATYFGGSIFANNAVVNISKSGFVNSYSKNDAGGAIYILNSQAYAKDLEIINCTATFGGAITSLSSFLTLDNFTGINNKASYGGGAVYSMYRSFEISNSYLYNNSAANGGALFADAVESLYIHSNEFVNNKAADYGGAIYTVVSDFYYDSLFDKALNNSFLNNTAFDRNDVYENENISLTIGNGEYILFKYNPSYNGTIPESYDLRQLGFLTPVRDQGSGGNCWAFTSLASLESAILKASGMQLDLSEENMKNIMAFYSDYGWAMSTNDGGYDKMGVGYLTSWLGPVNESDDSYYDKSLLSPVMNSFIHVQNILFFTRQNSTDNDGIKRAIIDYGAVGTCIYWDGSYRKGSAYYCTLDSDRLNHAVTIVGWDDNYSKSNFKTTPEGDGAWIIKNSWGTYGGDNGYYHVSYYDNSIAKVGKQDASFAFVFNDTIKYDKNYQYDIPGKSDYFINASGTVWYKNKFISTDDEYLAAVSTYFEKETNWDLSVYINDKLELAKSGFANPSYSTIELGKLIPLKAGDIIEVVFKITVEKEAAVPISEFITYDDNSSSFNQQFYTENISFISYDGINWVDFYDLYWTYSTHIYNSQVACIKAFTILNTINTQIDVNLTNIKENALDIIATVHDQYGNLLKYGDLTFNIAGYESKLAVENGIAKLTNVAILDGINRFNMEFNAVGYSSSNATVLYSSVPVETNISLSINADSTPAVITATVMDKSGRPAESGEVTFTVEENNYTALVKNGKAIINYTFTSFGIKEINAKYGDAYCYNTSSSLKPFANTGLDTSISLAFDSQYNPVLITATVLDENGNRVNTGNVTFDFGNIGETVPVTNGQASVEYVFTNIGLNRVTASYRDESYHYNVSDCQEQINVLLKGTTVTLENSSRYNPVTLTATVRDSDNNPVSSGKVIFMLDGDVLADADVVGGIASLNSYIFKNTGLNTVDVFYSDSYYYASSSKSISLNVSKIKVDLSLEVEKTFDYIRFIFSSSEQINDYITVYINGEYHSQRLVNGQISIDKAFKVDKYVINASLNRDIYDFNNLVEQINVEKFETGITLTNDSRYNPVTVTATVKDEDNNPVRTGKVRFMLGGDVIADVDVVGGIASLNSYVFKNMGVNTVQAFYSDSGNKYNSSSNSISLNMSKIKTALSCGNDIFYLNSNMEYVVALHDEFSNPISDVSIKLKIASNTFSGIADSSGKVYFKLGLGVGTYNVAVSYDGNLTYESSTSAKTVTVKPSIVLPTASTYTLNAKYVATLYDSKGNPLKNSEVEVTVGNYNYRAYTNAAGVLNFNINLSPGSYKITLHNLATDARSSQQINVVKRITENSDLVMYYGAGSAYTVRVLDDNGNPMTGAGVTFNVAGRNYVTYTDSNGYASFKGTLNPGTYGVTASYNGYQVSNKITVKPTLITKNVAVKKGKTFKFTVKLLNTNGKILKNKKVTIKFNGKTYKVKTNKKGIATLKVSTKKFRKGKFTITTKYGAAKVTNKITIR